MGGAIDWPPETRANFRRKAILEHYSCFKPYQTALFISKLRASVSGTAAASACNHKLYSRKSVAFS
jgi:hypothetical protein